MERRVTVEFGPSRSKRFGKAVAEAKCGLGECSELEPGRYRVSFALGTDPAPYLGLARLLQHVRHWRASEVYEGEEPVSTFHAREMAWCASSQLKWFGDCRWRFNFGILPRCSLCPLFDVERAVRETMGANAPSAQAIETALGVRLWGLLRGQLPAELGDESGANPELPDSRPFG
jgi:hypothetical protein